MDFFIEKLAEYGFRLEYVGTGRKMNTTLDLLEKMMAPKPNIKTFRELTGYYATIRIEDKEKFVTKMKLPESYLAIPDFFYEGFCLDSNQGGVINLKFGEFYSPGA